MLAAHVHSTAWASYSILQPHTTQNVHYIAGFSRRTVVIERMIRRRLCVATSALLPFHSNHTGEKTRTSSTEYTYWPSPLSAMQSKTILVECELIWLHSHHVFLFFMSSSVRWIQLSFDTPVASPNFQITGTLLQKITSSQMALLWEI